MRDGFLCFRVNTTSGTDVLEFDPADWVFEPHKDEVAIVPLDIRQPLQVAMFIGATASKSIKLYDEYIEGMSAMTCVVPAWRIAELLNHRALKKQRDDEAAARAKSIALRTVSSAVRLSASSSMPPA